ncbi:MAG: MmcQ/YjbR family DNA-binding protein [Rudanella sp.]|nr:MmcQ/YjbR family DNA-binding protein [Rudanella sp.]
MNVEALRDYCLNKPHATESLPFGPENLVLKVGGKVFALISLDANPASINLKCNPELAEQLREEFSVVLPGYHMNKRHWNTVLTEPSIKWVQVQEWIDHSYELVWNSLPKAVKATL